jgi:hypothetical protein
MGPMSRCRSAKLTVTDLLSVAGLVEAGPGSATPATVVKLGLTPRGWLGEYLLQLADPGFDLVAGRFAFGEQLPVRAHNLEERDGLQFVLPRDG